MRFTIKLPGSLRPSAGVLLPLAVLGVGLMACGESEPDSPDAAMLLPERVGDWVREAQTTTYDRETIFDYINGAGEVYRSYAFDQVVELQSFLFRAVNNAVMAMVGLILMGRTLFVLVRNHFKEGGVFEAVDVLGRGTPFAHGDHDVWQESVWLTGQYPPCAAWTLMGPRLSSSAHPR